MSIWFPFAFVTTLACYISGHGLGHAVRTIELLRVLRSRQPDLQLVIRTPLERQLFDFNLGGELSHGSTRLDVGAVQSDSLHVDVEASLRAYFEIDQKKERLIATEIAALAPLRPALVLADIPALAFDIAQRLDVPSIGLTNFSWDWIYADYARDFPAYWPLVEDLRRSYGRATLLLRLPLHGDLSAFPRRRDIPFIARKASLDRATVRERLDLPRNDRLILFSFGGLGLRLASAAPRMKGVRFVVVQSAAVGSSSLPGATIITDRQMKAAGVRYEDLVGASDAVMTKPGYGIVAECIANGTPMIYTERGRFAEYECLVEGIRQHLSHAFLDNHDLRAGRWHRALEQVLTQQPHTPNADISGADVAAASVLEFVSHRR